MPSLPQELIDIIIHYVHTDHLEDWEPSSDPARPRDFRSKSNGERLLRGPTYQYKRRTSAVYKNRRLVSRQFLFHHSYSRLLFRTILLYPHRQSFDRVIALSLSYLRIHVRHVVISLPFFARSFIDIYCHKYPQVSQFWTSIPPTLLGILSRFPNLDTVTILPSWDRKIYWIQGRQERFPDLERALTSNWYGCQYGHPACMGDGEHAEITNLCSLLSLIRHMHRKVQHLNVSNLGTEWIPFLQTQDIDISHSLPLSPAPIVHIDICGWHNIQKISIFSCALHDLVWFTPVFTKLKTLHLENVSARHSTEVQLFATTFNRHLFPMVENLMIKGSTLAPRDYLHIFTAIRNHGGITKFSIKHAHTFWDDGINIEFELDSDLEHGDLERLVQRYMEGDNISVDLISAEWFKRFEILG